MSVGGVLRPRSSYVNKLHYIVTHDQSNDHLPSRGRYQFIRMVVEPATSVAVEPIRQLATGIPLYIVVRQPILLAYHFWRCN